MRSTRTRPFLLASWTLACFAGVLTSAVPADSQARRPGAAAPAADTSRSAPPPGPRVLHAGPAGDTLATLGPETRVEVIGREGEWARVRVEGWVHAPAGTRLEAERPMHNVSLRALREDPERFRGQRVGWEVQFVSVQRADSLRTDFAPGERFILARDPGGEPGFVYLAVPDALLPAVRRLVPLQRVGVVGRIRTGRSALMGHPVVDLLELNP